METIKGHGFDDRWSVRERAQFSSRVRFLMIFVSNRIFTNISLLNTVDDPIHSQDPVGFLLKIE